jgi:ABC-2 type transport system ATP-binding protein
VHTQVLVKRYGKTPALQGLTVDLPTGRSVALVGVNGAGKTTFLKTMAGLVSASSGSISVLGRKPDLDDIAHTRAVSYLGQRHPLYGFLNVRDTLRLGSELNRSWRTEFASSAANLFRLPPTKRVKSLSGGQHSQLALVIALSKGSPVILLDEPMASLDPLARSLARDLVVNVRGEASLVVVSSHIVGELEEMCDYLVLLSNGQVILAGTFSDLLDAWERGPIYLEGTQRSATRRPDATSSLESLVTAVLLEERAAADPFLQTPVGDR